MGSPGVGPPGEKDFSEPLRLLVVADDDDQASRVQALLGDESDVRVCDSAPSLGRALHQQSVDCVVLAVAQGENADGTIRTVLSSVSDVPVVVIATTDEDSSLEAIHEGAQDYLLESSTDAGELGRAIQYAIVRKRTETRLARR